MPDRSHRRLKPTPSRHLRFVGKLIFDCRLRGAVKQLEHALSDVIRLQYLLIRMNREEMTEVGMTNDGLEFDQMQNACKAAFVDV